MSTFQKGGGDSLWWICPWLIPLGTPQSQPVHKGILRAWNCRQEAMGNDSTPELQQSLAIYTQILAKLPRVLKWTVYVFKGHFINKDCKHIEVNSWNIWKVSLKKEGLETGATAPQPHGRLCILATWRRGATSVMHSRTGEWAVPNLL